MKTTTKDLGAYAHEWFVRLDGSWVVEDINKLGHIVNSILPRPVTRTKDTLTRKDSKNAGEDYEIRKQEVITYFFNRLIVSERNQTQVNHYVKRILKITGHKPGITQPPLVKEMVTTNIKTGAVVCWEKRMGPEGLHNTAALWVDTINNRSMLDFKKGEIAEVKKQLNGMTANVCPLKINEHSQFTYVCEG